MWNTIEQMAPYAVGYTVPILITALGGLCLFYTSPSPRDA